MHEKRDECGIQTTVSTPKQEVGQGILGGVQICPSTPVDKPGEIVLAPTKGGKGEERRRWRAQGCTSYGRDGDAADGPQVGRLEDETVEGRYIGGVGLRDAGEERRIVKRRTEARAVP